MVSQLWPGKEQRGIGESSVPQSETVSGNEKCCERRAILIAYRNELRFVDFELLDRRSKRVKRSVNQHKTDWFLCVWQFCGRNFRKIEQSRIVDVFQFVLLA